MLKKISKKKLLLDFMTVVIIALITGGAAYLNDFYHAENVESSLKSTKQVTIKEFQQGIFFDGKGTQEALIFYPGAKVEATAYAPFLMKLAEQGVDCFLVEMPGNLAFLGVNKAAKIYQSYEYDKWYLGGHSLGGAMAANYTKKNGDEISGLLLLAAYSTQNISKINIPVVLLYGENDEVLNRDNMKKYQNNLPKEAFVYEIPGANHAYFGNYGEQKGDGKADISRGEQQQITIEIIKQYLR